MKFESFKKKIYGWKPCTNDVYAKYYRCFGGSACVHPRILDYLQTTLGVNVKYYHKRDAAFCTFNNSLLYHNNKIPFVFDDLFFPVRPGYKTLLPYKTKRLSPLSQSNFRNGIYSDFFKHKICYVKEEFSKTTVRKRNSDIRKIQKSGGSFYTPSHFDPRTLSQIYCELFNLRWQDTIPCFDQSLLEDVMTELKDLVFGNVLLIKDRPCAFDLIFQTESPSWIYYDDINGGVDPDFMNLGAGTTLLWKNIEDARIAGQAANKKVIFSLGAYLKGWSYKKQWCDIHASGRVII